MKPVSSAITEKMKSVCGFGQVAPLGPTLAEARTGDAAVGERGLGLDGLVPDALCRSFHGSMNAEMRLNRHGNSTANAAPAAMPPPRTPTIQRNGVPPTNSMASMMKKMMVVVPRLGSAMISTAVGQEREHHGHHGQRARRRSTGPAGQQVRPEDDQGQLRELRRLDVNCPTPSQRVAPLDVTPTCGPGPGRASRPTPSDR